MAIVKCARGHYYNDSEYQSCPYCSGENVIGKTIPLDDRADGFPKTSMGDMPGEGNPYAKNMGRTQNLDYKETVATDADNKDRDIPKTEFVNNPKYGQTVFIDPNKNSEIKPVRGWLVVSEGEKRGLDFRIHAGKNYVGRSKSSDICFEFDQSISKEKSCIITYDDRKNVFYIQSGEGTNNIYVNDEILLEPRVLKDDDIVEIGVTKLVFRAFCNQNFNY